MHTYTEQAIFVSINVQVLFSLLHKHRNGTELNLTINRGGGFAVKRALTQTFMGLNLSEMFLPKSHLLFYTCVQLGF
jgi:hypothetical protein